MDEDQHRLLAVRAVRKEDIEQLNKVNRLDLCAIADRFSGIAAKIIEEDLRINENRKRMMNR